MSAFTTLTICRTTALAKLEEVDINDLPEELGAWLMHERIAFLDDWNPGQLRLIVTWKDLNNGTLEDILNKLFPPAFSGPFYDFIVVSAWTNGPGHDRILDSLTIPSVSREKLYELSSEDQVLHNQLQEKGFKTKDILALFETREKR